MSVISGTAHRLRYLNHDVSETEYFRHYVTRRIDCLFQADIETKSTEGTQQNSDLSPYVSSKNM
jgi:hypothetical protein